MTRIRVLELIKGLDVGGAEVLLADRLAVTDRSSFDVSVGYLDPGRVALKPIIEKTGTRVVCLGARRRTSMAWLLRLRRQLRRHPVDVVHVHSPLMGVGVRLVLWTMRPNAPAMISTEHSVAYHPLTQWAAKRTVARDQAIVAVSRAVAAAPVAQEAGDRVVMVHHGVDLALAQRFRNRRAQLAQELGLPPGPLVVAVANYREAKGLGTLVTAAGFVHSRVPSARFLLVGSGPLAGALEKQIEALGLRDVVHLMGSVEKAVRVTACADVFALTSVREGLPVAVMEALACGVPVVATNVGGLPDLVRDGANGFLVPPGDAAAVASRIVDLLRDDDLRDAQSREAEASSHEFDMRRTAREVERVYLQVVREGAEP